MADSFIQLPADSTGKQLDTALVNMGVGTTAVHREKVVVADPLSTSAFAVVTSSQGLQVSSTQAQTISGTVTVLSASSGLVQVAGTVTVLSASSGLVQISGTPSVTSTSVLLTTGSVISLSSGTISLSSQITVTATGPITVTSGTITLSSVPTVFSASSGGIQAFIPISPTSSVAGAGFGPVTSSAGVLASLSSGTISLSSQITVTATGPVTVTSGTITSTAATNPWSSAPSFNVPVVTVSSGLVQISGTPTVTATFALVTPASTAGAVGPVSSSFGVTVAQTTGSIPSVINATSANPTPVIIASSGAITPATAIASSVTKVSSSAGILYSMQAFTTAAVAAVLRLYNASTSSVDMGANVLSYFLAGGQSTVAGFDEKLFNPGPRGFNFGTACSFDVVLNATSTVAVAGNTFVTWQFV